VVGVVADTRRFSLREEPALQFYVPIGQQPSWMGGNAFSVLVRAAGPPELLAEPLRRALHGMEPSLRYVAVQPFSEQVAPQRRPWRLGAVLFVLCGALALSIAVIGLYSVIAYLVLHRRHEIGVRMALGAERGDVVGMVLGQSLRLAGGGVIIGAAAAFLAAPHIESLLFDTAARDVLVFAGTAGALLLAALLAGLLPALRASRVAPTEALKQS
jgi:putative ABC transport system permease protein